MSKQSKRSWWKWLIVLVLLVVVAVGFFIFRNSRGETVNYNTVTVARGHLMQTVTATGTLNPVKSVQVGCQVSGRISDIYVDYNSQVKAGDLIAEIDPRTYQAQVESAQADLANATANLELQQVQARRAAELYTNNLVSGSDYDTALATLHQAEAVVKIKQASLDNAQASLGYTKIYSPVDGVVISRSVDVGQTVAASFNTPTLFLIANDLSKMQIDANVDEADIGGVKEHQQVDFTVDAYPNRTFNGIVSQVRNAPTTVNNVVTYDSVIGVTNADFKLKPGMTASVSIIVAERTNVLEIPNSALRFHPPETALDESSNSPKTNEVASASANSERKPHGKGGHGHGEQPVMHTVYILKSSAPGEPAKPVPVEIQTGITDNIYTEVISGLNEGDEVITGLALPGFDDKSQTSNPFSPRHRF
jgi:HlyD family secretion protein